MANRYNPPQKRPANITANYFTPLTITSDANTNSNASISASARHIPTSLTFPQAPASAPASGPASAPTPGTYIHALRTHPSSPAPTTMQPQMPASATLPSALTTHSSSHLRGDSTPYTPIQPSSMTSPSSTAPNQPNLTLPHQTSRPQTAGLTSMPALQPTWPTPSPRCQKPLPSQPTLSSANVQSSTQKQPKPSVKHLTCYFWSEFGHCQWSSNECLYAHWYTGKVANAPVQVEVGSKSSLHKRPPFPSLFFFFFPFISCSSSFQTTVGIHVLPHVDASMNVHGGSHITSLTRRPTQSPPSPAATPSPPSPVTKNGGLALRKPAPQGTRRRRLPSHSLLLLPHPTPCPKAPEAPQDPRPPSSSTPSRRCLPPCVRSRRASSA